MRLFDADELYKIFVNLCEDLRRVHEVDAVEVVRCKDCKHADQYYHCIYMNKRNTADGYCYCGERAEK